MTEATDLLTPQQTAAMLGLSAGTLEVWRCTKRYPLDFVKIGGRVRYRRQDVEKFIEARITRCGPEAVTKLRRRKHSS